MDFRNINKSFPNVNFPLPNIDMIINSIARPEILSFDGWIFYYTKKRALEVVI